MGDTGKYGFPSDEMAVSTRVWGSVEGREVHRIDFGTEGGFAVSFTTYGATLLSVRAVDKAGKIEEVTLQHDTLEGVVSGNAYYGSLVGRVCNRIGGAKFSVDGKSFPIAPNNGPNCLHGGAKGFDKVLWRHEVFRGIDGVAGVIFEYDSPAGEEGFPGSLAVKVTYSVKRGSQPGTGELHSTMEAKHIPAERGEREVATPVNLTNHAYWNLSGEGKRSVKGHDLFLRCDRYLPLDETQIPTGELKPVLGTFFDFSEERSLGAVIDGIGGDPPGLDHCLVGIGTSRDGRAKAPGDEPQAARSPEKLGLPLIARLHEAASGRTLEAFSSQPAVQVYTANFLSDDLKDAPHVRHYAVCLETQHFPNAVNHPEWADAVLLKPEAMYRQRAVHVFTFDGAGAV